MTIAGVWFRKSLRLHDNLPLIAAAEAQGNTHVVPFFCLDTAGFSPNRIGKNRYRFLLECLADLDTQLKEKYGSRLVVFRGKAEDIIEGLIKNTGKYKNGLGTGATLGKLYYEFDSEPFSLARDKKVDALCAKNNVGLEVSSGHTLLDLRKVKASIEAKKYKAPTNMSMVQNIAKVETASASPDKLKIPEPKAPPKKLPKLPSGLLKMSIQVPKLSEVLSGNATLNPLSAQQFPGGETEALQRLQKMVAADGQKDYICKFEKPKTSSTNVGKKINGKMDWTTPSTTGLSPYLKFGCISVRKMWHAIQKQYAKGSHTKPPMSLQGQLLFREMFYICGYVVDNWDQPTGNSMCKDVAWSGGGRNGETINSDKAKANLKAWQEGKTGFPYIDALMRQLNATGWMHHLGRHAVSCFLTRGDLYLNWTHGRDYFDKQLLDADWALNNGNWLWLAGVAPFSMPFFRVYNPSPGKESSLNAEQTGEFIKFWVPELANLPARNIYEPWKTTSLAQMTAKCIIGKDYPKPIVDHSVVSKTNIAAFGKSLKNLPMSSAMKTSSGSRSPSPMAKRQRKSE